MTVSCYCGKRAAIVHEGATRVAVSCGPDCYPGVTRAPSDVQLFETPCSICRRPVFSAVPVAVCGDCDDVRKGRS